MKSFSFFIQFFGGLFIGAIVSNFIEDPQIVLIGTILSVHLTLSAFESRILAFFSQKLGNWIAKINLFRLILGLCALLLAWNGRSVIVGVYASYMLWGALLTPIMEKNAEKIKKTKVFIFLVKVTSKKIDQWTRPLTNWLKEQNKKD